MMLMIVSTITGNDLIHLFLLEITQEGLLQRWSQKGLLFLFAQCVVRLELCKGMFKGLVNQLLGIHQCTIQIKDYRRLVLFKWINIFKHLIPDTENTENSDQGTEQGYQLCDAKSSQHQRIGTHPFNKETDHAIPCQIGKCQIPAFFSAVFFINNGDQYETNQISDAFI